MKEELELYLHIPFCVRKCNYCDFLSAGGSEEEKEAYVKAMLQEIQNYREMAKAFKVKTVFLGGGTPSLLTCRQVDLIFEQLYDVFEFEKQAEITMEVNPGTVDYEKIKGFQRAGVNRLSIGLQSVHDEELQLLGRIHTYEDFRKTWNEIERAGFDNRNIDLMLALPGQTLEKWERTLREVISLNPEHISAYSLILEEGTNFYQWYQKGMFEKGKEFALPSEEAEYAMGELTSGLLEEHGLRRYEISNYAKPGKECRHNIGYWERTQYLGIGAGASSLIHNTRFNHVRNRQEYIRKAAGNINIEIEREVLDQNAQMEEFMFLGLRKIEGVSIQYFKEYFGKEIKSVYGDCVERLLKDGLVEFREDRLRLTHRGMDVSNYVLSEFLL